MTTVFKEKFNGLKMNFTAERREYTGTYLVKNGNILQQAFPQTLNWQSLGIIDPYARLVALGEPKQLSADWLEVAATWSTIVYDVRRRKSDYNPPLNPLSQPVRRRWGTAYLELFPPSDLVGNPIAVCTGEPVAGGVPIKYPYLIRTYVRNEPFFNETACRNMIWAEDSSSTILCAKFDASEEFIDGVTGVSYVEVTYEFWCLATGLTICGHPVTWDHLQMQVGSYWRTRNDDGSYTIHYLTDGDNAKGIPAGGVPLDANTSGGKLSDSDIAAGHYQWTTFIVHRNADFGALALPGLT